MKLTLFDLVPSHDRTGPSFSPFCMRARLALLRKGVPFDVVDVTYDDLRFGPWKQRLGVDLATAPILQTEDGSYLMDSTQIALHLDRMYPDRPNLFLPGAAGPVDVKGREYTEAVAKFESVIREAANPKEYDRTGIKRRGPFWCSIFWLYARRINTLFDSRTKTYWTDDDRLGACTWKDILEADQDAAVTEVQRGCKLLSEAYLTGSGQYITSAAQPGMTDFALFGDVQLIRSVSPSLFRRCFLGAPSTTDGQSTAAIDLGNFPGYVARMDAMFPMTEVRDRDSKDEIALCQD